jgi:hypothetical protein
MAWLAISRVGAAVWVLAVTLVVVLGVVVAGLTAIVGSDMAVERQGSGLARGGWRLGCGAVVCSGSVHHRF